MARTFVPASSNYLRDSSSAALSGLAESFTVAAWYKFSAAARQDAGVISIADGANKRHLLYFWNEGGTTQRLAMFSGNGATTAQATVGPITPDTNWHLAVGIVSATNSRQAYLDTTGGTADTTDVTGITGMSDYVIGQYFPSGSATAGFYADGDMAEAAIWNVALTEAEITSLYRGASPQRIRAGALVSYVPIIGRASPEPDLVSGDALALNGTPAQAAHPRVIRLRPRIWRPNAAAASSAFNILRPGIIRPARNQNNRIISGAMQ